MTDDEKMLLLELRVARADYDALCSGRTAELTEENPPMMTDAQIATMKRLMHAEQSWKHRND